jgi:phosphotransferase system enzyme I (PtsP)
MGGRPLEALALIAIGYRSLSMSPAAIGPIKSMILSLDLDEAQIYLATLLAADDGAPSLRERLRDYAISRNIPI